jgi:hypothetical protein
VSGVQVVPLAEAEEAKGGEGVTELVKSLTAVELSTLDKHEAVINRGLKTFADVGNSLLAIRDGRLYREQHGTFEEYCRERWGFTDRRARMLMSASEVVERIGKTGTTVPVNEAQARPLARLPAAEQPEAWEAASNKAKEESRPVTARDVEAEVEKRTSRDPLDTGRTAEETEVQEDKDSATLYHLKRYWNMATKKDRKQFRRWMDENKD